MISVDTSIDIDVDTHNRMWIWIFNDIIVFNSSGIVGLIDNNWFSLIWIDISIVIWFYCSTFLVVDCHIDIGADIDTIPERGTWILMVIWV